MLLQGGNDPRVGGRKRKLLELSRIHPAHLLAGQGLGLTAEPTAEVHHKAQTLVAVGVLQGDQLFSHLGFDRQLLLQLAHDGGFDRLTRLLLATGEFPEPSEQAFIEALINQHLAF